MGEVYKNICSKYNTSAKITKNYADAEKRDKINVQPYHETYGK